MTLENIDAGQSILEVALKMILNCTIIAAEYAPAVPAIFMSKKGEGYLEELSDKEEDFIDRAVNPA